MNLPYVYPGGKRTVAELVWDRLGDVDVFADPFYGGGAVPLLRPASHSRTEKLRKENVNDVNHHIVNFWRAVQSAPDEVARHAVWPPTEADLQSRHQWLVASREFRGKVRTDPTYYDAKRAGWWVWGINLWIGGAWCLDDVIVGSDTSTKEQRPQMDIEHGVNVRTKTSKQRNRPIMHVGQGTNAKSGKSSHVRQMPLTDSSGAKGTAGSRPQMADAFDIGRGTQANYHADTHEGRVEWLTQWMRQLRDRTVNWTILCGHWKRLVGSDSVLTRGGTKTVGVFLDPPYPTRKKDGTKSRDGGLYAGDGHDALDELRDEVLAWCQEHGPNPLMRIAVCGYEGDGYESLGWEEVSWEANGGYANQHRGGKSKADNAHRERIWFSPHCERDEGLFEGME